MVDLSTREHALNLVSQNPDWNVLDLGCGSDGIQVANVYADIEDRKQHYPGQRFVLTDGATTPFADI